MRIVFTGTGDIGIPTLSALLSLKTCEVVAVICQPDKPVGRKQILTPPATKTLALAHGIPVHQPPKLRLAHDLVASLHADLMVVIAYGQILPQHILDLPRLGCINLHASLLPLHRGAAPIQAAILSGHPLSGITVMQMDAGLDSGDIIHQESLTLTPDETGGSLHDRLAALAPVALLTALPSILDGSATRTPQNAAASSHIGKLSRTDGLLDWSLPAASLERRIRAFDPWPGTTTSLPDGAQLKIFPPVASLDIPSGCPLPGTILHAGPDGITVACGSGSLTIHQLQAEGRRRLDAAAFLSGHPLSPGDILGIPKSPES